MAQKGVNLLDDDGDENGGNGQEGDLGDDLEGGAPPSKKRPRKKGGGGGKLIQILIIAVVALVVVGGGAWATYQFWWLPREKRKVELQKAKEREQQIRKERLARLRAEAEQRKQALAILKQVEEERKPGSAAPETPAKPEEKAEGAAPAKPGAMAKKEEAPKPTSAEKPPAAGKPAAAKEVSPPASPEKKPPAMAPPAEKKEAPKPAPAAKAPPAPPKMAKRPAPAPKAARPSATGRGPYSVQVATCRTDRCVSVFVRRLREKGFTPHVTGRGPGRPMNEVLLGTFPSRNAAEALARQARARNIRATLYQAGGEWRVSAGSFGDLEDAAQLLDRVEDAGLKGELASRPGRGRPGLRTVRTGRFSSRKEALETRARVVAAGFPGSFVTRR